MGTEAAAMAKEAENANESLPNPHLENERDLNHL